MFIAHLATRSFQLRRSAICSRKERVTLLWSSDIVSDSGSISIWTRWDPQKVAPATLTITPPMVQLTKRRRAVALNKFLSGVRSKGSGSRVHKRGTNSYEAKHVQGDEHQLQIAHPNSQPIFRLICFYFSRAGRSRFEFWQRRHCPYVICARSVLV